MSSESNETEDRSAAINDWDRLFQNWRLRGWLKCGAEPRVPVACGFCSHRLVENVEISWEEDRAAVVAMVCGYTLAASSSTSASFNPSNKHHWAVCTFGSLETAVAQANLDEINAAISKLPELKPWDVGARLEYLGEKGAADSAVRRTRSMASQRLPRVSSSSAPPRRSGINASSSAFRDTAPARDTETPFASGSRSANAISPPAFARKRKRTETSDTTKASPMHVPSGSSTALRVVARPNATSTGPPPTQPNSRLPPAFTIPVPSPPSSVGADAPAPRVVVDQPTASRQSSPISIGSSPEPESEWSIVEFFDGVRDGKGHPLGLGTIMGQALESAGIKSQEDLGLFNAKLWRSYLAEATPPGLKERFVPLVEEYVENWLDEEVIPAMPEPEDEYAKFLHGLLSGLGSEDVIQFLTNLTFDNEKTLIGYKESHWLKLSARPLWTSDPLPAFKKWILMQVIREHLQAAEMQ